VFEKLDVVIYIFFRHIGVLALCPVCHIDEILQHLCHPFLEINHLGEWQLGGPSHRLHVVDE
jgi:hypothetical protein